MFKSRPIVLSRLAAWWNAPARHVHVYAMAAVAGVLGYLVLYRPDHLLGTSTYWQMPQQDEAMALMGYRYFLHEDWHWPIFVSHTIDVPYATSVAFNDCIPLWALINKAVATVVPPWGTFTQDAYLGLWHALVYALQACFGVACLRALGHRSWRSGILSAGFFLAVPAWIFRYGHAGLSAHWIELWALWLYLRTPPRTRLSRRLGLEMLSQLVVASMLTPYHPVMSLGILCAAILRTRDLRSIALWLPLGLFSIVGATYFSGYFAGEGGVRQWGFEKQSTNLLSWLIPVRSGIVGDGRWIANVMATEWQWEGYAYLGLGFLGLLVLFLPGAGILRDVIKRHHFLFAVALGFWCLALSNHIFLGAYEVASYRVPWFLRWVTGQFRAPGRFVWVPMYVLMMFVLHQGYLRFSSSRRFPILVALLVVQLIDVRGDWRMQRERTDGPASRVLERGAWSTLIHAHNSVRIFPTFACITGDRIPWVSDVARGVQFLASERALPINGTYSTRTIRNCAEEEGDWRNMRLEPNTLYVLLPQASFVARQLVAGGGSCGELESVHVCTTNRPALSEAFKAGILTPTRS